MFVVIVVSWRNDFDEGSGDIIHAETCINYYR